MEVIFRSIENVLLHISRNSTYPNWGRSHQVRISEVLLYHGGFFSYCTHSWRIVLGRREDSLRGLCRN